MRLDISSSPYYSNADRERLARQRKEGRLARRQRKTPTQAPVNFDNLPAIEEIYSRKYTGNATIDPIGGRKRYTYYLLFKDVPSLQTQGLEKKILDYIWFLKNKMSCRDIVASTRRSPVDGAAKTTLEYPMREYGEIPRNMTRKPMYQRALMAEFNFKAPVQAGEYIQKKFYADNDILRFMVLSHTRTFKHLGEDNELHL